ncbi:carbamoyltransferase C-terminal domain-containing protein [Spirulina subsalsa]|uniref:carbamoyltransferase C-terminal domain-containing protein n=1 Tax=Spirulina subsalsa TaxID=54311 RepID=UPI0002DA9978|nr:carbamoyltransferase C-terminal domain-containing protein [Spirulina subsalsa]
MTNFFLGIHYGHNATVAVVHNGKLIFCQSEERLNRIKNSTGFPEKTLAYIYENICQPNLVESATLFQQSLHGYLFLKQHQFKPFQYGYFLSPEIKNAGKFQSSELMWKLSQWKARSVTEKNQSLYKESLEYWSSATRLPPEKIRFMKHHAAHAYSVFPHIQDWSQALVFTLDGVGDYVSATVSRISGEKLELIQKTDHRNSLGYFYSAITALLGMKAGEHEFKVMGLAPYSSEKYYKSILDKLRQLIWIDETGQFVSKYPPTALTRVLDSIILHQRFDNVAGAIQALVEELIIQWIRYWTEKTGIRNVAVSGGVFMNVKACQKVLQQVEMDRYFVMPSAADESTAIGAAYWGTMQSTKSSKLKPFEDLYLGMTYSEQDIEEELINSKVEQRYLIRRPENISRSVAQLLADNEVVARYAGRMEFGARALGNRSILANPSNFETIELINASIKNRDFWMPFTPSILDSDMPRYIVNHNKIFAPYMVITFDTTDLARQHLKAAIHPRDKTARPQCVLQQWNPEYYELISEFKKLTGIGAVLNTSFNLHGEPNVCSPRDAIHTMDNSGLRYLAIGHYLLEKRETI